MELSDKLRHKLRGVSDWERFSALGDEEKVRYTVIGKTELNYKFLRRTRGQLYNGFTSLNELKILLGDTDVECVQLWHLPRTS